MLRSLALALLALAAAASVADAQWTRPTDDPNTESGRECRDGLDNDNDGTADCDDPDCASGRMCGGGGGGDAGGRPAGGGGMDTAQLTAACPTEAAACTASATCTTELATNMQTAMMAIFTGQAPTGSPEFQGLMTCVVTAMRSGGAAGGGGGGRPGGGGGGDAGGRGTDDPATETGRECRDGLDNDGDGTADCDDPDCAAIAQLCGDPTCFVAGSEYNSARCCDTSRGAEGDTTCWGGGYDFARCCPPDVGNRGGGRGGGSGGGGARPARPTAGGGGNLDCSLGGFGAVTSSGTCPSPKPPARVPDTCPDACAVGFNAWTAGCGTEGTATLATARRVLGATSLE